MGFPARRAGGGYFKSERIKHGKERQKISGIVGDISRLVDFGGLIHVKPHLETGKNGARCLIVYYSMALNNYDEAIAEAEAELNPEGERLAVICYPERSKLQSSQVWKRRATRQSC